MGHKVDLHALAKNAKAASFQVRLLDAQKKREALLSIAETLNARRASIMSANAKDLKRGRARGLSEALLDRLSLVGRFDAILQDIQKVAALPDPVGEILEESYLPNGLKLLKKRVPIGVLAVIYEARPNVTIDVIALALKTGNCAILRGGKETFTTNLAIMEAIGAAMQKEGLPIDAFQLLPTTGRGAVKRLLTFDQEIDLVIPRGGAGLHAFCRHYSRIPVITGGVGICHLFVDATANIDKTIPVIVNAKTQRPSVCNALDTLLIHRECATALLNPLVRELLQKGVSFRCDERSWELLKVQESEKFHLASKEDWQTEWLSLILGIKIVDTLEEAMAHIQTYGSGHSDGILTNSAENAALFVQKVDSAAVYINASTRFTDGGQFGLGAEVAISTQKLHARGPMGLKELTTYKWIVEGNYHSRD
jgi:glutamate-5-semialdehyde dehydrogenase